MIWSVCPISSWDSFRARRTSARSISSSRRRASSGLADEQGDRRYLVIDGIDGSSHCADNGEAEGSFPVGSIVRRSNRSTEPRRVDRTVAEIAAAKEGRYSIDIHLPHDPTASEAFAATHVRRLEAIRRRTGAVERERDGTWTIPPDRLDRVRDTGSGTTSSGLCKRSPSRSRLCPP
ncbi:MAG: DUF3363 domain-containing protein [Bradyrhizobium sp.]